MNPLAVKTRFTPRLLYLGTLGIRAPEMGKLWRLLGEVRIRQRFTAVALCEG